MTSTLDKLVYMANQIARNFEVQGAEAATVATADHIASFWDPRMKSMIFALHAEGTAGLSPIAEAAIRRLRACGAPAHQTHATEFNRVDEVGRSDAG